MSASRETVIVQASAVAIDGRALLLEGAPGSGKSSLALALIDRGAELIGDDGVTLSLDNGKLTASPPPNIAGKLEIRGIGITDLPTVERVPVALILALGQQAERLPDQIERRTFLGFDVPCLSFQAGQIAPAVRAEWALRIHAG